jgi:hypothetical protein
MEADGPHTLTVVASNELMYTHSFTFYNGYHSSSSQVALVSLSALALAASVASIAGLLLLSRRVSRSFRFMSITG